MPLLAKIRRWLRMSVKSCNPTGGGTVVHSADHQTFASRHRRFCGSLLATLSAFMFALCYMIVKFTTSLNVAEANFARVLVMALLSGIYCSYNRYELFKYERKEKMQLAVRTASGIIGSISGMGSVRFISLPTSTSIRYISVAFTALLSCVFLKERLTASIVLCICTSTLGVVIVTKPELFYAKAAEEHESILTSQVVSNLSNITSQAVQNGTNNVIIGVALALASAFCMAVSFVVLRKIMSEQCEGNRQLKNFEVIYILSIFSLIPMAICSVIWRLVEHSGSGRFETSLTDIWLMAVSGIVGLFAQISMNASLKLCDANYTSLIRGTEIVFAFAFQPIFGVHFNFISLIGIALIVGSVMAINLIKLLQARKIK